MLGVGVPAAVALKVTTFPHWFGVEPVVMFDGQEVTGALLT